MDVQAIVAIVGVVSAIGGAGGAWGATNQRIKQTERELSSVRTDLSEHEKNTRAMGERLARIEGLLTIVVARVTGE